uniref:RGS domain-containing protein n=1 Tax=Angiostrongylus cantonensis TaxID=6313 RepID=A0A158PBN3_ANGCA
LFLVDVQSEDDVRKLLSRSLLLKSAYFYMFMSKSYEGLCDEITSHEEIFEEFASILPLNAAPVDLNNPDNTFTVLEEFASADALEPNRLFFCRLVCFLDFAYTFVERPIKCFLQICHGQAKLKTLYDIKRRLYIGNTTMDPELAFIQFIHDADDQRSVPMLEEGKSSKHGVSMRSTRESVMANFEQYGTGRCFLSGLLADACWHAPYGIREKGQKIGKKPRKDHWTLAKAESEYHFPEKQPYSLEKTFTDLCDLAAKTLLIGSKLSFWFPTIIDRCSTGFFKIYLPSNSYSEECLPVHPALRLIANCEQRLSRKTSRRLLVYQKYREALADERAWCPANHFQNASFRDVTFTPRLVL